VTTISELGEDGLLHELSAVFRAPHEQLTCGIGDDAAVLAWRGDLVATVDSIEAGTDWLVDKTPRDAIGWRAAAVNLSDLAAMGARPVALLCALDLPGALPIDDVLKSARGLAELASRHGASIAGGDISIGGSERWSVTAMGDVRGRAMTRDRARPGDAVWLIGEVGMAAVGLAACRMDTEPLPRSIQRCVDRHLRPRPLVDAGRALQQHGSRLAAIDVSDGLARDAGHLARSSGVHLELAMDRPNWLDDEAQRWCESADVDWRAACASGGDDYALVVTAPRHEDIAAILSDVEVSVRRIGHARATGAGERLAIVVDGRSCALSGGGFVHG